MTSKQTLPQFMLRFSSSETKDWLVKQSKANHRSVNSEINFHLENNRKLIDQQETTNVSQPTQTN